MYSTPRRRCNGRSELKFVKRKGNEADVIDVINKLQNKLTSNGKLLEVPLPQIVVEGGQSSGKSSVLESIIGRDFLPRGTGTVTRRPTIIQLHPNDEVYAEFLHRGSERFTDFERVKQEIKDETMRDPGPNGFSSKPISLKIYAPNVLKLTFVDMPGIIKNVTPDMPKESVEDVERMILKYIEQPNSIILAVSPANQDIATSDAIEMASRVDPKRERTLCVLTKLDLMDRGTDARDILENRVLPLAKGYIGVVNRSQEDIDAGKDFQASLHSEKRFFENHPAYSHMADLHGSVYLQKRLQIELIEHIRKTLPAVRKELSHKLSCMRKDLKKMDQMMGFSNDGVSGAQVFMQRLVHQFIDDIHTNLFGHSEYACLDSLKAGAIINYKMHVELEEILKLPTELSEEEFMNLIANVHGTRNILSIPSVALEAACGSILEKYREPLEIFVDSISSVLISAVENSCFIVSEYPALKEDVVRFINESIDTASEETKDLLGKHLDSQMRYCNVYHWDFNKCRWESGLPCKPVIVWNSNADESDDEIKEEDNAIAVNNHADDLDSLSDLISGKMKRNNNMKSNSKNMADIVTEYIRLVQKQIADTTLKYINCFLVHQVFDFIKTELMIKLLNSSNKDSILEECEQEFQRRNELLDLCADIEEALVAAQAF
ncbi:dynamin-like [Argiope bruennichi]|uniref:dynamin-like n=1 Tax=Argiope bruennichi TaxID=94029 RepID=UPI00249479C9|nr:dynamin-like [Argiope bruennichi]